MAPLSHVIRMTSNPASGNMIWEKFTTHGFPKECLEYVAFASHYQINELDCIPTNHTGILQLFWRKANIVCAHGIQMHLNVAIASRSAFRVRVILFQTPFSWSQISMGDGDGEGNGRFKPTNNCPQGGFNCNGGMLMDIAVGPNGVYVALQPTYDQLFQWQRKTYDHVEYQQIMDRMRITKPIVKVIFEKHLLFTNRKMKLTKRAVWNHMYSTRMTWKYQPMYYDGSVEYHKTPILDRKVFMMLIMTPIFGEVKDPAIGNDMPDVDLETVSKADKHVQRKRKPREESVLADKFEMKVEDDAMEGMSQPRCSARLSASREATVEEERPVVPPEPEEIEVL